MKSLQKQLSYTLSIFILMVLAGLWWSVISLVHYETENHIQERLASDTSNLIKHLSYKNGQWQLLAQYINPIYQIPNSGHYFAIQLPNQTLFSPSLQNYSLYMPSLNETVMTYETKGPQGETLYVRAEKSYIQPPLSHEQKLSTPIPVTLYVVEDHGPVQHNLMRFDIMFAIAILLTLILLFIIQKLIIQKTFSTLKPLEKQLQKIEHSGQPFTIQTNDYPIEIQPLLLALQNALQKLQKQLASFRKQNANLAHSLKTPIHVLYQKTDSLKNLPTKDRQILTQQLDQLTHLIERELKKARISETSQIVNHFDLQQDLPQLLQSIQTLYQDKGIQIKTQLNHSHPCLPIEKEDGYELLGNLLDNAAKWCCHTIQIQLTHHQLIIEDDGPGVAPDKLQQIQQRGIRLDESIPGHGLGLSIVQDIVRVYEMDLQFQRSQKLEGLKVQISFNTQCKEQ